jgi:hypothetical protein
MNAVHGDGWYWGLPAYFVLRPEGLVGIVILVGILLIAFSWKFASGRFILFAWRPVVVQIAMLAAVGMLMDMSAPLQLIDGATAVFTIGVSLLYIMVLTDQLIVRCTIVLVLFNRI